jgi:hypothetical protein
MGSLTTVPVYRHTDVTDAKHGAFHDQLVVHVYDQTRKTVDYELGQGASGIALMAGVAGAALYLFNMDERAADTAEGHPSITIQPPNSRTECC